LALVFEDFFALRLKIMLSGCTITNIQG